MKDTGRAKFSILSFCIAIDLLLLQTITLLQTMGCQQYILLLAILCATSSTTFAAATRHNSEDGDKGLHLRGLKKVSSNSKENTSEDTYEDTNSNLLLHSSSSIVHSSSSLVQGDDIREVGDTTSDDQKQSFYDLQTMSDDEKVNLMNIAYSLYENNDNINWDKLRMNYIDTVYSSASVDMTVESESSSEMEEMGEDDDEFYNEEIGTNQIESNKDTSLQTHVATMEDNNEVYLQPSRRQRRRLSSLDGEVFGGYQYSKGNCPNPGSLGVPCAPPNVDQLCNKYDRVNGSLKACINACKPAFCCIHDSPGQSSIPQLASSVKNCNTDENCPAYNYCYIAWWKLHDTVGPANFLRLEQDDDFYDIDADEVQEDSTGDQFFTQVLLHHFDDLNAVVQDGTVGNEFDAERIFVDQGKVGLDGEPGYWYYPITSKVEDPPLGQD